MKIGFIFIALSAVATAIFAQDAIPTPVIPEAEPPVIDTVARPAATVIQDVAAIVTPSADAPASVYGMSFGEAWGYGGWIMWVLLAVSVFAVALVIYLTISLREASVAPHHLVTAVCEFITKGEDASARRICEKHSCAFSSLAITSFNCLNATGGKPKDDLLRDFAQSEGARLTESMQSQAQFLLDLAAIAPMLGLLGTTLGMLQAFGSIAQDVMVAAKPIVLAQGVSKAIITTIAGLMVAIPCMFMYAIFRRRVSRIAGVLEKASSEVITAIIAREDDHE